MAKVQSIQQVLCSCIGSNESTKVTLHTDVNSGESSLIIEKTFTERVNVTEYDQVMSIYKKLTGGNGRRVYSLKDFI